MSGTEDMFCWQLKIYVIQMVDKSGLSYEGCGEEEWTTRCFMLEAYQVTCSRMKLFICNMGYGIWYSWSMRLWNKKAGNIIVANSNTHFPKNLLDVGTIISVLHHYGFYLLLSVSSSKISVSSSYRLVWLFPILFLSLGEWFFNSNNFL